MDAASIRLHLLQAIIWKVAHAIHSNSDVVQMVKLSLLVLTIKDVIAHKANSDAALIRRLKQQVPTLKDVTAQRVNLGAVWMEKLKHKAKTLKVVNWRQNHHKKHVVSRKIWEHVTITRSNTSLMPNMVVVHASGMEDVMVIKIDSNRTRNVRVCAKHLKERMFVICLRLLDHVLHIIQCSIMTLIEMLVLNLYMEDVWVMLIDLKNWRIVRASVSLMIRFVSIFNHLSYKTSGYIHTHYLSISTAECEQPIEQGPCEGSFERWGYDKDRDVCTPFVYGGCKGTKNNYLSESACNYHCKTPGIGKSKYGLGFFSCFNFLMLILIWNSSISYQ